MIKRVGWLPLLVLMTGLVLAEPTNNERHRMSEVLERRASSAQFMGAVLVSRGQTILLDKGYGKANLEWKTPNSSDTRFRLASLTKQFTAAGILLLKERGKVRIEDPVSKYLLVTSLRNKPLDFSPGTDFRYTNSGYIVLGYVLEKISNQPYADFIRENIFTPLNMRSSGYDSNAQVVTKRAQGYVRRTNGIAIADYIDMTVPFSAGGLYSTTSDLLRWEHDLFDGQLLAARSMDSVSSWRMYHLKGSQSSYSRTSKARLQRRLLPTY
jgi:CubicO group peptidase (beta-lactamase class C family)